MAKQKSLKVNFIMNAILTMSSFIFPLITFPYVSRILMPEGMGKVNFAISVINYFSMFAQLGIPTYGIRICAQVRDDHEKLTRTAHELLFINFVMTVISYVGLILAILFVPKLASEKTLYIITSFIIFLTAIGMEWLYKALEQYTYITIRSIVFKFIGLIAMFMLVHAKSDYIIYAAISVFSSSGSFVLNLLNAHKYIGLKPVGNYNVKKHLKPILVFFSMSIATTIYTNLDTVMLGFMKSDADVGYYTAATKIKNILVSIVTSLGTVLLPRASYYIEQGNLEQFKILSKKAMNFVFLIAVPMMIYFILFAKQGIVLLSGKAFMNATLPMQLIMPTLLFIGITNITGIQILVPLGYEKIVLLSTIAGAIVDLVINWLLIPSLASSGASIGTLAAEFVVLVVQYFVAVREVPGLFREIKYYKIIIAVIVSSFISFWTVEFGFGVFITLVISAVLFFGIYGIVLIALKEQLTTEIFNQLIKRIIK
ncbi:flippase [Sharpea porci]|uniref:flippase n=1 Tax=Sharpea porci TaxID=2652286 RepID=UPI002A90E221|nr:flippase [Sharpea porci]MDY5279818.1 flippase [Sharpea porci]